MPHEPSAGRAPATVTPYLAVRDAAAAIEFYQRAFGAVEEFRLTDPAGRVVHAHLRFGDGAGGVIMLAEEQGEFNASPQKLGGTSVILHLEVADADALVARAVAAGARVVFPVKDQFYGQRAGRILDPFGHAWLIATTIEDVTPAEMQRRFDAMMRGGNAAP